jgi:hypothetical protein
MAESNRGRGLFCCVLLLGLGGIALADGNYQSTRDGKTIVWNQNPKTGDSATWTGDRDRDGYASGFGTLSWYTQKASEAKETLYARYFGNMIQGKFDGPVNGHSKGVTGHAVFSQGKRISRWAAGPVPSWKAPQATALPNAAEAPKVAEAKIARFNPPPPSYGVAGPGRPTPDFDSLPEQSIPPNDIPEEGPELVNAPAVKYPTPIGAHPKPKLEMDESLRLLTGPLPSLRDGDMDSPPTSGSPGRLSEQQVIQLADSEARRRGYDVSQYQRSSAQFDPVDNTWSLVYEQKAGSETVLPRKRFTMAIDGKSRRTAVVHGR